MPKQSDPIISVSGLRGVIGTQLTPAVAIRYISALASTLPPGKVVLARDGRGSGRMLAQAVGSALIAHGLDAIDLGVAATPTVGVAVRMHGAVAGVQISASHNPQPYNGLKLFGPDGRVLTKVAGEKILDAYRQGVAEWVAVDQLGSYQPARDAQTDHAKLVMETVNAEAIRGCRYKILLDSNRGAGSLLGRQLLTELGCRTTLLGDSPDGRFEHPPEPVAANLTSVCSQVEAGGFDVGFCQDPDADRLAVIDENGRYIGEELTLALCLLQALPKNPGTVVTNCATSSVCKAVAAQHDCRLVQSAVGEANVADLMLKEQAVFGGEGNGGPIDPAVGYVRDSFVGMAKILDLLASSGRTLSQLVAQLPDLAIFKDKMSMDTAKLPSLFAALEREFSDAQADYPDGLKLDWGDRWLLVRGSNTEPIVRLIAEARSTEDAEKLCARARAVAANAT